MKAKDFLRKSFEDVGIRDSDLEAVLGASSLSELEIPDTVVAKFNESYLTRTRAENDPQIVSKIQKGVRLENFSTVDKILDTFYDILEPEKAKEIGKDKIFETYKRMEAVRDAIRDTQSKKTSKTSEEVQKVETQLRAEIKAKDEVHAKEKAELLNQFKGKQLDNSLKLKVSGYKIADNLASIKENIFDSIIAKVKGHQVNGNSVVLDYGDDGQIHLKQNVDGTLRDIYEGNEPLRIEKLLDQYADPFIVKSNATGGDNPGGTNPPKIKTVIDPSKMTLHEMIAAQQ